MERLTRRVLGKLALAAVAAPAAGAVSPALTTSERRNFVLVHGTWHGGWCWAHVAEQLRAAGHRVFTPTATGCGERRHLIRPDTNLDTHIQDVVNVLEFEELEDVTLIGHSFAGLTITGVADRLPERIRHLVFFDALIPTAERRAAVMLDPETGEYPQWWLERAAVFEDGYKMHFWDHYPVKMLVPENDEQNIAWLRRRLSWHPAGQWTQPLELHNGGWEPHQRTCIHCVGQIYSPSSEQMVGPARGPGWNFIELDTARNGFMTDPERVSDCLMALG